MGRLGPLTAQALGRSPYDDVVEGTGEEDPRVPQQMYDSRGRPYNPETKRIHREIIRSHNEVMQVIGVAEPENQNAAAEQEMQREHYEYEENMGLYLMKAGRALEIGGVWGINGLRQRILLYRQYSEIPFFELWQHERSQRSLSQIFLAGLPTYLAGYGLKWLGQNHSSYPSLKNNIFLNGAFLYVRVHMQLFVTLQRLNIISPSQWFPSPSYFIPFSSTSPIAAPPPLKDFTTQSLLQWTGSVCINATPMVAYIVWRRIWTKVTTSLWQELYRRLPNTVHRGKRLSPSSQPGSRWPTFSDGVRSLFAELRRQFGFGEELVEVEAASEEPPEAQTPADPTPAESARRPSAFSVRGDDYASDEEDHETLSATLISFDVEATESNDAAPTMWSAELRPSLGPEPRSQGNDQPIYLDTMLTRLPACLAADTFTVIIAYIVVAPYEAISLRLLARAFRHRAGLPTSDLYRTSIFHDLTLRGLANFFGIEFTHLVIAGEFWALVTSLANWFHITEEEWKMLENEERKKAGREIVP